MTREDIRRMAREAGFNTEHDLICIENWEISPYLQRFAALVAAEVDKNWTQGKAKISIPTLAMEREFSNYHRLGYKAGVKAEREACARVSDQYIGLGGVIAKAIRARGEK